jgi:hypothetical protein
MFLSQVSRNQEVVAQGVQPARYALSPGRNGLQGVKRKQRLGSVRSPGQAVLHVGQAFCVGERRQGYRRNVRGAEKRLRPLVQGRQTQQNNV